MAWKDLSSKGLGGEGATEKGLANSPAERAPLLLPRAAEPSLSLCGLQTPYFWMSTQWLATDLDYGEYGSGFIPGGQVSLWAPLQLRCV